MDPEDIAHRAAGRIGTTLRDKWRVDALLGSGGMASVFRATHRNGAKVAIKILHPEFSLDTGIKRRFLQEGYAANAVDHPGVVRVIDDDVTGDGSVFLVMDLLEGETAEQRWVRKGHVLSLYETLTIARAVLDVLVVAHAKGIVHRDIKPENVFLTTDGRTKLLDFGVAQVRGEAGLTFATRAGATVGTPAFMSPEQALGHNDEIDGRSDLWAVGALIFTLASGKMVNGGRSVNEQLVFAATRAAPPFETAVVGAPREVMVLVDRALAFDRAHRWPDALSMKRAIEDALPLVRGASMASIPELPAEERSLVSLSDTVAVSTPHGTGPILTGPSWAPPTVPTKRAWAARVGLVTLGVALAGGAIAALRALGHPETRGVASGAAAVGVATSVSAPVGASPLPAAAPAPNALAADETPDVSAGVVPVVPATAVKAAPSASARRPKAPRAALSAGARPIPSSGSWLDER